MRALRTHLTAAVQPRTVCARARCLGLLCLLLAAVATAGCGRGGDAPVSLGEVRAIDSPTGKGSGEPNLLSHGGRVYLSWVQSAGEGRHALRFSVREDTVWSKPKTVAEGRGWFVNWADFPSLAVSTGGYLAAHWLQKNGEDTYAYGVRVSRSLDGGTRWSDPIVPHEKGIEVEHGFVSMLPWPDDRMFIAWLDGRNFAKADGGPESQVMTLRSALMDRDGRLSDEIELDGRVCDCCQTAAVLTPGGALVAYRDRSANEVRDISLVRYVDGRWTEPVTPHDDGWEIHGCPVNGPAVAAENDRVAIAWFTHANELSRVKVSFSTDGGATFAPPIRVDDGDPIGRVDVVLLADGTAIVCWMEATDEGADIRFRQVDPGGVTQPSRTLTRSSKERASGFPQMARAGDAVYFAWTLTGDPSTVRTAALRTSAGR